MLPRTLVLIFMPQVSPYGHIGSIPFIRDAQRVIGSFGHIEPFPFTQSAQPVHEKERSPRLQFNKGYDHKTYVPDMQSRMRTFSPPAHPPRRQGKLRAPGRFY
jgi:hypothetical protein